MNARRLIVLMVVCGLALAATDSLRGAEGLKLGAPAPEITAGPWINSVPLTLGWLRGRVVLVEFWTYG